MRTRTGSVPVRGFALGALLALVAQSGGAQGVSAPEPAAAAPVPFRFPRVERRTMPNGLRLVVVENHSVPLVLGRVVLDADSLLAEPSGKEGLLQFVLAMLPEGTTTATGDQIAAKIAAVGNEVFIGQQLPTPMGQRFPDPRKNMSFMVATPDLAATLDLIGDMFSHPSFPADAIERVRSDQTAALRTLKTRVSGVYVPLRLFDSFARGGAPLRGATESGLAAITRQDLIDFYSRYVRPQLTTLVLVGDVSAADAAARVDKAFGAWSRSGAERIVADSSGPPPATTIYLVDRPGATQSALVVGTLGPPRTTPDRPAIDMLNAVFDQATDSRLGTNIRAKHGYAYFVAQANTLPRAPSPMTLAAYSAVAPAKTDSALIEWISEIKGLATRPPTESEMTFARGLRLAGLPKDFETSALTADQVANTVARSAAGFDDAYAQQIQAVTPSDIVAAARKYLDPAHLTIVVYGDRKVVEAPLRAANIAPVMVVDENGKAVP